MRVSNLSPGQLPAAAELEGQAKVSAPVQPQAEANTPGLQVQLLIQEALETLLVNLAGTVDNSQLLLNALPDGLRQEVQQILQQAAPDTGTISQGMNALVQLPKTVAEQLQSIVQSLQGTLYMDSNLTPDIWNTLMEKTGEAIAFSSQKQAEAVVSQEPVPQEQQQTAAVKTMAAANIQTAVHGEDGKQEPLAGIPLRQPVQQAIPESADAAPAAVLDNGQDKPVVNQPLATESGVQSTEPQSLPKPETTKESLTGKDMTAWTAKALQVLTNDKESRASLPAAIRQLVTEFRSLPETEQNTSKQILLTLLNRQPEAQGEEIQPMLAAVRRLQDENPQVNREIRTLLLQRGVIEEQESVPATGQPPGMIFQGKDVRTAADVTVLAKAVVEGGDFPEEFRQVRLDTLDLTQAEQQEMQKAVVYLQDFLPQAVKQAAVTHNLPELPDLWMLFKFSEASKWKELPPETLHKAIRTINELSATVQDSLASLPEKTDSANTMSFTVPIYFGDGNTVYPAYVRIYHEQQGSGAYKRDFQPETWLRIFFDTNHIGRVDAMFHLYQGNMLSVRTEFSSDETADAFRDIIGQVRGALGALPLTLTDFSVRTMAGEIL